MAYSFEEATAARALLERSLAQSPPRLDWAALAVAALEHPNLDVAAHERRLEELSQRVRSALPHGPDRLGQLQALRRVLGDEEGFNGDAQRYTAPENAFLNVVLERKQGLPITLSVLYLEVARRAGIPLFGVAFPGHFVVASDTPAGRLVMDPFHGGAILTEDGCADLLSRVAPQLKFTSTMLTAAPVQTIAARLLTNLKRTYLNQGDGERALRVIDLLLLLTPDHPGELRARATVLSSMGAYRAALADVERCLELSPQAPDHVHLRMAASTLRQRVAYLN